MVETEFDRLSPVDGNFFSLDLLEYVSVNFTAGVVKGEFTYIVQKAKGVRKPVKRGMLFSDKLHYMSHRKTVYPEPSLLNIHARKLAIQE
jgi:hypothetical protein